jgi:hypothetical protein
VQFAGDVLVKAVTLFYAFAFALAASSLLSRGAFWIGWTVVEVTAVVVLALATAVAVWWAFGPGSRGRRRGLGRAELLGVALAPVGFAVGAFAGATTLLFDYDHLDLSGKRIDSAVASGSSDSIIGVAADFYLWHLLDSVPLLDIPATVRWKVPYEYADSLSGWLLLAFKAFVILPLIQAVRLVFAEPVREAARPARSRRGAARQAPR